MFQFWFQHKVVNKLGTKIDKKLSKAAGGYKQNLLKLEVFFYDLTTQTLTEEISYQVAPNPI